MTRSLHLGGITSRIYPYTIFGPYLPINIPNILSFQPRVFEFDVNGRTALSFLRVLIQFIIYDL